jgi:hypothetical protein
MSEPSEGSSGVQLPGGWYYRLIQSYGYERDGGSDSIFWRTPTYFSQPGGQSGKMLDEAFDEYRATRGNVSRSNLQEHTFLKCTSQGLVFIDRLRRGGELREASINDLSTWWTGRWAVTGGKQQHDGSVEAADSGFLVLNIGEYSDALFLDKSSGMLVGPEHDNRGVHVFVWLGYVSDSGVLDAVMNHVPTETRRRAQNAVRAFTV